MLVRLWRAYQRPIPLSMAMPAKATRQNQARLLRPFGSTTKAASSGPSEEPKFPPTWKIDCAKPWRPPEASLAMREDSGWKIDEPIPSIVAPPSSSPYERANASTSSPSIDSAMPTGSDQGSGLRSVNCPTTGCSSEAVT